MIRSAQRRPGKQNREGGESREKTGGKDGRRKEAAEKTRSEKECGEETDRKKAGCDKGRDKKIKAGESMWGGKSR